MKLTIERDILSIALSRIASIVGKSTIPILGCIKIAAADERSISILGQGGAAAATQTASALVDDPGVVCVQADKFSALIASLPPGSQVALESTAQKLTARYGRGHASFVTDDPRTYPVLSVAPESDAEPFEIEAKEFRRALDMTLPFASTEESRSYLRGVYLRGSEGWIDAVATDGNGLVYGRIDVPATFPGVIIPHTSCAALIRILAGASSDVRLSVAERGLRAEIGSCSFQTKLVDGTFPDFQRVIPAAVEKPVLIESVLLAEIAKRIQIITEAADASKARPRSMMISAENTSLRITGGSDADQEIDEELEIEAIPSRVEIRLGTAYVLAAVSALGEGLLEMHIVDPQTPALIRRADNVKEFAVLMRRRY